jgi:hypothetical protein
MNLSSLAYSQITEIIRRSLTMATKTAVKKKPAAKAKPKGKPPTGREEGAVP